MAGPRTLDPLVASVAAYTDYAAAYERRNAGKVADRVERLTAGLRPGARILDAGCGPGRDLARFSAAGHRPIGVDLNPAFLAMAAEHGPVVPGDLRALPFPARSFDAVWACASLVHLDPAGCRTALAEFWRVARTGARVYASVKCVGETGWQDTECGRRWFQSWSPVAFAEAFEDAGFRVRSVEPGPVFVDVWAVAA